MLDRRDTATVRLLVDTGRRLGAGLTLQDVDFEADAVPVMGEAGGAGRCRWVGRPGSR